MVVRSKTLRLVILVSTVLITVIVSIQLFWLQKVYLYEAKQFNINVSKSIKSLYARMQLVNDVSDNVQKAVENPSPDLYLLKIDCLPNLDSLWINLKAELTDFDVYSDCKAAMYSADKNAFIAEKYIDLPDSYDSKTMETKIPLIKKDYSYILLFFPHRSQYIIKQMIFWIASSGFLLLILICLGMSIFYLYRQKFFNETQKDFVDNFTHEFKTPLAVMKIAADVLQQKDIFEKPDKLKSYAAIIQEQTTHLQTQVQRLLEMAYTDKVFLRLKKETFDINNLLQQAVHDLAPLIEEKNAIINISFESYNTLFNGDKVYLRLTYINLIENAIKYSKNPLITLSTYKEGKHLCISVKDNGIGMDTIHHKRIFERFYRIVDGDLHNTKGFGLGLNFVKKVVDAHGGKIEVRSNPGKGSTFIIKF